MQHLPAASNMSSTCDVITTTAFIKELRNIETAERKVNNDTDLQEIDCVFFVDGKLNISWIPKMFLQLQIA